MNKGEAWGRYCAQLWFDAAMGVMVDVSRMDLTPSFLAEIRPSMETAFRAMEDLEGGAEANPDEARRVGHYWLRAHELAPDPEIGGAIGKTVERIASFAGRVHRSEVRPQGAHRFSDLLLVGIGGSALGPQFVADALAGPADKMKPHFVDNTDPDGIDRVLQGIGDDLKRTLCLVVSKSGGTKETRNAMLEIRTAYESAGLDFGRHAVAVTGEGSALESLARDEGFLDVFPMWDWVGGRTSVLSAVGLLPAALQGLDIGSLLGGAREMDERTRRSDLSENPAALLAASWYAAGNGRGDRDMVVLPYKDRLALFSRYLQQLVMESLGKEKDLDGKEVHQGIVVYGNKGSTDQHAYVQQLRDGPDNFFVTFIEVQKDRARRSILVEEGATAGDYLLGFLLGTRQALHEKGRRSLTVTLSEISPRSMGMLIALYERAVGLYAGLTRINAYDQPGVEAGKRAASEVLTLQRRALAALRSNGGRTWELTELARHLGAEQEVETLFKILEHAAANPDHGVVATPGGRPWTSMYGFRHT